MILQSLTKPNTSLLNPLKESFNVFLKNNIIRLGDQNKLRDACEFALLNGGKRIRPLIVMMTASALDNKLNVLEASLSVEYFHTASLIADDLPCMDNDDFRRKKPSLHKIYGETIALLASYALISAGYEKIFQSVQILSKQKAPFRDRANETCVVALDSAVRGAGISGAVGGQYKDLFPENKSLEEALDVINKKTVTLFEVAFIFGWIFGGGDLKAVERVRDIAHHFGIAFQIADDLCDMDQDRKNSLNIGLILGQDNAYAFFEKELACFIQKMIKLDLMTPEFQQMIDLLIYHAKAIS